MSLHRMDGLETVMLDGSVTWRNKSKLIDSVKRSGELMEECRTLLDSKCGAERHPSGTSCFTCSDTSYGEGRRSCSTGTSSFSRGDVPSENGGNRLGNGSPSGVTSELLVGDSDEQSPRRPNHSEAQKDFDDCPSAPVRSASSDGATVAYKFVEAKAAGDDTKMCTAPRTEDRKDCAVAPHTKDSEEKEGCCARVRTQGRECVREVGAVERTHRVW
ncbi:hypothetical protein PI126_g11958 [Phytophthora idaei]|nr:hypothetical protein PI126_g11958 [Phytophthora idaei]